MGNLISYENALKLTLGKNAPFYESKFNINGYDISIFNYRIAQYSDFKDNNAFDIRGITFVFNKDGSLYKRYLLLHKFFNINQVEETQYSIIKSFKIKSIYNKEDGSVASFIRLPNGEVVAKSKMSFHSDQAVGMMRLYNTRLDIKTLVDWSLDNDLVAIFEYVSPENRIVLRYDEEDLILLRLRDNKTGDYLDLENYLDVIGTVKVAPKEFDTLDNLLELSKTIEDKEGWIVQFVGGLWIKVKTDWYFKRHGLITDEINRENIIIKYVLQDEIDDVLSQIPDDEIYVRDKIENITLMVREILNWKVKSISESWDLFNSIKIDCHDDLKLKLMRKSFSLKYKKDPNFSEVMSLSNGADIWDLAKKWVEWNTRRLEMARDFLENYKK